MKDKLSLFVGGYATEEETAEEIRKRYESTSYVIDPHTAVASHVYHAYADRTGDRTPTLIASTASPFKFETSVMRALGKPCDMDDLDLADALSAVSGVPVPAAVSGLRGAEIRHKKTCRREEMEAAVLEFLGI